MTLTNLGNEVVPSVPSGDPVVDVVTDYLWAVRSSATAFARRVAGVHLRHRHRRWLNTANGQEKT